jgi:hypothetical protein
MRRTKIFAPAFLGAALAACTTSSKPVGDVPPGQRSAPLTPADRATLTSQGASCSPNQSGPVVCTWQSGQISCDLTFDDAGQLTHLECRDDGLTFVCTRPADDFVCTWSDAPNCGDVYDSAGAFLGYFCDSDLDRYRHRRGDGGVDADGGSARDAGLSGDAGTSALEWFPTCGPPVINTNGSNCSPSDPPVTEIRLCGASEAEGLACSVAGDRCQIRNANGCQAILLCSDTDPRLNGCPISMREYKRDIRYLDDRDLRALRDELLSVRLTKYFYKKDPQAREHLGFIIDDGVPNEAVDRAAKHVDLYGYTSLAVAALEVQAKQIEALEREIADLRARVGGESPPACFASP